MSKRYIDANKLIERLMHNPDFLTAPKHSKDGIIDEIVCQPTADVAEVRHGRWESQGTYKRENILMVGLICSECHFSIAKKANLDYEETMINNYLYCPECGAKMDGERREYTE